MVRRVVCRSLQPHETLEAEDGMQALEVLREARPKVAILDWMMPGLSGLEVCKEAQADPATARTIFVAMTARREADAEDQALQAGFSHFIRKPFMPNDLTDLVLPLLNGTASVASASMAPDSQAVSRYKVKSDAARNRLMIRAAGRLTEATLNAIMDEAGRELTNLEPGNAVWIDLRATDQADHAFDVHMQQFYALVASTSPSKVGTLVDDVSAQMHIARIGGQGDSSGSARVFTDEPEWLRFLR